MLPFSVESCPKGDRGPGHVEQLLRPLNLFTSCLDEGHPKSRNWDGGSV
jgi:hypothetical protein